MTTSMRSVLAFVALVAASCATPPPGSDPFDGSVSPTVPFGGRCESSFECLSGVCLEVESGTAICTHDCSTDADCPAAINWGCIAPSDAEVRVCGCTADATREVCGDRRDNDCDGDVDDCRLCEGRAVADDDPEHCGACFRACASDEVCVDGECECAAEGAISCEGVCVDASSDVEHCGACGNACASGWACTAGVCACPEDRPSECGDECVDLTSDRAHCGACGNACPAGQACIDGDCGCADGDRDALCPGIGCVDLSSDELHCGACDTTCAAGEVCSDGSCRCPTDGFALCGGVCRDVRADADNCGGCGVRCPDGEACLGGSCTCPGGLTCGGACVRIDEDNCGACGRACRGDQRCTSAACACISGTECGGSCVDLLDDDANCGGCGLVCGSVQSCVSGRCACPVLGTTYCAATGSCVDLQTDESSCGACGNACPAAQRCVAGRCVCGPGETYCAMLGTCVDLSADESSCGACGTACVGEQVCMSGRCGCPTYGETYCASAGECVNLSTDESSCGWCSNACEGPTTCQSGTCRCPSYGETYCASAGACLALSTDEANCGACGRVCATGQTCTTGTCRCPTGQVACGGACVDTQSDAANCGACGTVCSAAQTCSAGVCYCPAPTPLTASRITTDADESRAPRMATDGTRVAVVWNNLPPVGASAFRPSVRFQLLTLDGVPLAPAITLATGNGVASPAVAWNGSEWSVVWVAESTAPYRPSHPFFQRIASDGTPIDSPVNLATSFSTGISAIRIAYAPGTGLAVLASNGSLLNLLVLGTGVGPFGIATRITERASWQPDIAGAPDGRFGVLVSGDQLQVVNADGSITTPVITFTRLQLPRIAHDGTTWLVVGVIDTSYVPRLIALRGPTLSSSTTIVDPVPRYAPWASVASASGGTATVVWNDGPQHGASAAPGRLHVARLRLPTSGAAIVTSRSTVLLADPTADHEVPHEVLHVTPGRFVTTWIDRRWGQPEIYTLASDVTSCP